MFSWKRPGPAEWLVVGLGNPGPKYDAEGVGGILNIVTVGSGLEGYTATFSANVSNRGAGGGAFGTIKSGKLTPATITITTTSPATTAVVASM